MRIRLSRSNIRPLNSPRRRHRPARRSRKRHSLPRRLRRSVRRTILTRITSMQLQIRPSRSIRRPSRRIQQLIFKIVRNAHQITPGGLDRTRHCSTKPTPTTAKAPRRSRGLMPEGTRIRRSRRSRTTTQSGEAKPRGTGRSHPTSTSRSAGNAPRCQPQGHGRCSEAGRCRR